MGFKTQSLSRHDNYIVIHLIMSHGLTCTTVHMNVNVLYMYYYVNCHSVL